MCKNTENGKLALEWNECIRLYNEKGEHVASLLTCIDDDNSIDLALPDGKVLYCGVENEFVECIKQLLPVELLPQFDNQKINQK